MVSRGEGGRIGRRKTLSRKGRTLVEEELLNSRQQPSIVMMSQWNSVQYRSEAFFTPHAELSAMSAIQFSRESAGFGHTNQRNHLPH